MGIGREDGGPIPWLQAERAKAGGEPEAAGGKLAVCQPPRAVDDARPSTVDVGRPAEILQGGQRHAHSNGFRIACQWSVLLRRTQPTETLGVRITARVAGGISAIVLRQDA